MRSTWASVLIERTLGVLLANVRKSLPKYRSNTGTLESYGERR
jgi:hypothetical protein